MKMIDRAALKSASIFHHLSFNNFDNNFNTSQTNVF